GNLTYLSKPSIREQAGYSPKPSAEQAGLDWRTHDGWAARSGRVRWGKRPATRLRADELPTSAHLAGAARGAVAPGPLHAARPAARRGQPRADRGARAGSHGAAAPLPASLSRRSHRGHEPAGAGAR